MTFHSKNLKFDIEYLKFKSQISNLKYKII